MDNMEPSSARAPGQKNPMENRLVVEKICSFLPLPLLMQTRLVNSNFSHFSTLAPSFDPELILESDKNIKDSMKLMERRLQDRIPFARFYIDLSMVKKKSLIKKFGSKFGSHIKHLRIEESCFSFFERETTIRSKEIILELLTFVSTQLQRLEISTKHEIILNPNEQARIRGRFSSVRILSLQANVLEERPIQKMSLGVFLISQCPNLQELIIPQTNCEYKQRDAGMVNAMLMKEVLAHKQNDPILRMPMTALSEGTRDVFQEMVALGLKLRSLATEVWADNRAVVNFFRRWMTQQSKHMEKLQINIWLPEDFNSGPMVKLPEMVQLKALELEFNFRTIPHADVRPETRVLSIQGLPNLSSLILRDFDGFGTFATLCLLTVKHLELHEVNRNGTFSAEWCKVLPNLTSLVCRLISVEYDNYADEKLSYILSHFPGIQDLELEIKSKDGSVDFWDILTGDALPVDEEYLLQMPVVKYSADNLTIDNEQEEEDDRIPSLENFKRLRKLVIWPGSKINLQAVIFMSLEGWLQPLQHLEIQGKASELQGVEVYKDLITDIHKAIVVKLEKEPEKEDNLTTDPPQGFY